MSRHPQAGIGSGLTPKNLRETADRGAVTLYCTVEITEGELAGREVPLAFRIKGPDRQRFFVRRDLNDLFKWVDAVGVTAAANGLDLLKELGAPERTEPCS